MGTFKFACKMLKREKRQAISYGVTVLFTVFVSFIFFNIINNDTLIDQTAAASGGSFSQVSVLNRKLYPSNNCKLYYPI